MRLLLSQVGSRLCGVPLEHIDEIMRPLAIVPLAGAPSFVLGAAVIRGRPVPVLDAQSLLGLPRSPPSRFITLKAGQRTVALAVSAILGVRSVAPEALGDLPPLLQPGGELLAAIGSLDDQLLLVLRTSFLVPDSLWAALESAA